MQVLLLRNIFRKNLLFRFYRCNHCLAVSKNVFYVVSLLSLYRSVKNSRSRCLCLRWSLHYLASAHHIHPCNGSAMQDRNGLNQAEDKHQQREGKSLMQYCPPLLVTSLSRKCPSYPPMRRRGFLIPANQIIKTYSQKKLLNTAPTGHSSCLGENLY